MNKKFSLRDVLSVVILIGGMIYYTIAFFLGNLDSFSLAMLIFLYAMLGLFLFIMICLHIISKIVFRNLLKTYLEGFNYLKFVHKRRYQLYFSKNKEELDDCSTEIQTYGKKIVDLGNYYLTHKGISKKQVDMIKTILDKTHELMKNDLVVY